MALSKAEAKHLKSRIFKERDQKMRREELYGPRLFSTTLLMHAAQTFSAPAAGAFLSNGHTGMFPAFYCYCFSSLSLAA
jgi:hypothetical protein